MGNLRSKKERVYSTKTLSGGEKTHLALEVPAGCDGATDAVEVAADGGGMRRVQERDAVRVLQLF
ncbi:hypothetical protein SESBI_12930 [Sesbania bispinosa]|nr:hypothetical protein SESBI_12930 [Sesbania bispinosa]